MMNALMTLEILFLFVGLLGWAREGNALVQNGQCETINLMLDFDADAILGNWYDVAHYPIESHNGSCSRVELVSETDVIHIRNMMVDDGKLKEQRGTARLSDAGEGVLTVTFELENGEDSDAEEYYILGTDYNSYALVYSCRNLENATREVFTWKLSRTLTLTDEAEADISNIISNTDGLIEEQYEPQEHSDQDCDYVPELVPGQSVLRPGRCEWARGMEGIDMERYLGWWHEIERYPTDELRGECSSIEFTPNFWHYRNVDEIDISEGVANQSSCTAYLSWDGAITMFGHPFRTFRQWYIIDTDYETYSLLYSCEQVNTTWGWYRQIWSAKHSKQRSLTTAAQNAMSPLIEAHRDLHSHLYETVDQSDSTCFYYPDAGEQVILPGQCDPDIPVQPSFNISKFAGTWYQIERYPLSQVSDASSCIGSLYTVNNDGVTVLNWAVMNGVLNTTLGRATVNEANMTVILPDDETTVLRILRTDYENYALVYTCANINAFQRSIGAFKLSRTRRMTNVGLQVIELYMTSRPEFHPPYFISVEQNVDCEEPSSALLVKSCIFVLLFCVILQMAI